MQHGGLAGSVFNAAKEKALDAFIAREIGFLGMASMVEDVLTQLVSKDGLNKDAMTLDTVANADQMARKYGQELIAQGRYR
jgi:1-deoxy-D-xylulose-5-phosphate reductoisomerase